MANTSQTNSRRASGTRSPRGASLSLIEGWRGGVPLGRPPTHSPSLGRGSTTPSHRSDSLWGEGSDTPSGASGTEARRLRRKRANMSQKKEQEQATIASLPGLRFLRKEADFRKMDRELKIAPADPLFAEYYKNNPIEGAPVDLDEWTFVEANSIVELNHLRKFGRTFATRQARFRDAVDTAADYVSHLLDLPVKIPFPTKEDLSSVKFQRSKFPGIEYARRGLKTREEAQPQALYDAEIAYDKLLAGEWVQPQLSRMGGRGKFCRKEKLQSSLEDLTCGRLIFMGGQRDVLLNGLLEQPLTQAYKDPSYPISLGKTWWHGGTQDFVERFAHYEKFSCFDAASFDSSLPDWLIRLSLNILRGQFEDGFDPDYDQYWEFIYQGVAKSEVMLDNGLVFGRDGGSTSGHNFNTLMQSVATLIISYTVHLLALPDLEPRQVFELIWVESLGDDQHLGAKGAAAELTVRELAPLALDCFGVDWAGDKSFDTAYLLDPAVGGFESSQYLGKYFRELDEVVNGVEVYGVVPYRPEAETILRLAFPERGELSAQASWQRAVGHYADSAGNPVTRAWLEGYMDWLSNHVEEDKVRWTEEWARKFTAGVVEDEVPVPARRISYEEWLRLVLV